LLLVLVVVIGQRLNPKSKPTLDQYLFRVTCHEMLPLRGNPFRQICSGEQVKQAPNQPWIGTLVSAWWNASIPMNKVRTENERL